MKKKILLDAKRGKEFIIFSFLKFFGEGVFYFLPLVIAKFISPEEFGSFSLVQMIVMILLALLLTSSQTPFIVNANKEATENKKINKSFTVQLFFFSSSLLVGFLIFALFKNTFIKFIGISPEIYIFVYLFYAGIGIKSFFENIFLALDKKKTNAIYALAIGLLNISIVLFFKITNNLEIHYVLLSYLISALMISLFFFGLIPFKKIFPLHFDKIIFKENLQWTLWQVFGLLSVQLINWGDNLVLRNFVTLKEVGVYNVAYQIFKGLIGATFIINTYFLPFIAKNINNKNKIYDYLYNKRIKIFLIGSASIFFLFLVSPILFNSFYEDNYSNSLIIFRILLFGLIPFLYSMFYLPIFNSYKRFKFIQITNLFQVIINLILSIIFVYSYGLIGVAFGTTLSYFLRTIIDEIYFRKKIKNHIIKNKNK
jgi:O-antigen/teichoic acid export membrane protein